MVSMRQVSKRELNQRTAQVLACVTAGETVVVTERGVAHWRIEATDADTEPLTRLRAQGRTIPAESDPAPWPEPDHGRPPSDVDALLADLRDER